MPYSKGDPKINRKGRPKGSRNIVTDDIRANISAFIAHNWPSIQQSYEKLDADKQLIFFEKLLRYSVAPLQSINLQAEMRTELETLSESQVVEVARKILSS